MRLIEQIESVAFSRLIQIFLAGMLCLHVAIFTQLRERIWRGYPDFTVLYTGGMILRQGLGPRLYDATTQQRVQEEFAGSMDSRRGPLPYIHPPFEALIFVPLTRLSYRGAFLLWDLLNVLALFKVALILRRHLELLLRAPVWKLVLSFLAFFPVFICLLQGQDSVLLLLFCALAYGALKKERDVLAGCWLAMAALKPQVALPLLLLLVLWRRQRVALGFSLVAVVLGAISFVLIGWQGVLRYPGYAVEVARTPSWGGVPAALMPNLRGLIEGWPWELPAILLAAIVATASAALFFLFAKKGRVASHAPFDLQFSMAVVVAVFVSWHTNAHDLSLLILPLALLGNYCYSSRKGWRRSDLAVLVPTLPLLISPLWILLWLGVAKLNLMAIPILWWGWEIAKELTRSANSQRELIP